MKYRRLGKTNLKVSVIGIGTWQFGGEWGKDFTQDEVDRMFARGGELGLNLIDTAECYGDHLSESLIGRAIEKERGRWVVATKFGHKFHGYMNRSEPRRPADVVQQLEESLKALRTDYVDLYQFHSWGNKDFDQPEVWNVLEKLLESGKVRHVGSSISPNDNLYQIESSDKAHIEAIQVVYNRLDRKPEQAVLPACRRLDLGVLARVPLASGMLSGRYKPGKTFAQGDYRSGKKQEEIDEKLRQAEQVRQTEVPPGADMAQWSLAWCLQHEAVSCVIPGCKSVEQVQSNAAAASLAMVREDHPLAWQA
jgi:aryl-alcohol dehydrogenase-like predicted oxidoreductase